MKSFRTLVLASLLAALPLAAQVTINNVSLPTGTRTGTYGPIQFTGSGNPTIWSISAGTLPPGLTLSSGGVLSGTITSLATNPSYEFTVRGQAGAAGPVGTRNFSIFVVAAPTLNAFSPTDFLPVANGNVPYDITLSTYFNANGGVFPLRYELVSGPSGFFIDPSGTRLLGAPRVIAGSSVISLRVVDANNAASNNASKPINIEISETSSVTSSLPNWTVGRPYFAPVQAANGGGYYTWTLNTSSLPTGVSLDSKLSCPALVSGVGAQQNRFLQTSAGLSGGSSFHSYQIISGSLPTGVSLSSSGSLRGTPQQSGTFNYELGARDQSGLGVRRSCSLVVTGALASALPTVTACPLPFANANSFYSSGVTLQNSSVEPSGFQLISGSLPFGMGLSTTTGEITGIPGSAATSDFTIRILRSTTNIDVACSLRVYPDSYAVNAAALVGTPSTPGSYLLNASVQAELGGSTSFGLQFTINPAPVLSTATLPSGSVGSPYSSSAIASALSGGTSPFNFQIISGSLPPGIQLLSNASLSGSPSSSGTYNFTVQVTDAAGATSNAAYSIQISNPNNTLEITTPSLPIVVLGDSLPPTTITASGGTGSGYRFLFSNEITPPGFSLTQAGLLTGTPNSAGFRPIPIGVEDSAFNFASRTYNLQVTTFNCPVPAAILGSSYNSAVTLSHFTPLSYLITSGQLPSGLALNTTTGAITGIPSGLGSSTFTVRVLDTFGNQLSKQCSIAVQANIQISSALPHGRVTVPYSSAIGVVGGTPPYTHAVVSGSLPPGLTLDASSGRLSGTPLDPGAFTFKVRTQDAVGSQDEQDFTLRMITRDRSPEVRCILPSATVGSGYSSRFGLNSNIPATFTLDGSLPSGLSLNPTTGMVTGTPTQSGFYSFYVVANLSSSTEDSPVQSCQLQVSPSAPPPLAISCPAQSDMLLFDPYASPAIATGGLRPYTYSLYQSSLPPGLTFDTQTGLLSGTLTALPMTYSFTASTDPVRNASAPLYYSVSVRDAAGNSANSSLCINSVSDTPVLTILTPSLPTGTVGGNYSARVDFTGGTSPYTASIVGTLPSGITFALSGNSVIFSGSPNTPGTASVRVLIRDGSRQLALRDYSLNITTTDPLRFTSAIVNGGTVGVSYTSGLDAAGGAPPYRFAQTGGTMAPGLTLNSSGGITGVPTTAGTFRFEAEVTDAAGSRASATFALVVFQGNFRLGCPALTAEIGVPYNSQANVLGGSQPYLFVIAAGQLPPGLTLDSATGTISGRPTTAGAFIFTFGVSDARQARTQTQCSIGVVGGNLRIITEGPINTRAGQDYTGQMEAAGGSVPYTWTLLNAAPEAGITIASTGAISGRATRRGTFAFTVQARDAAGATATRTLSLVASDSTLSLACPATTGFQLGVPTTGQFVLGGGVAPYRVNLFSGNLPPGFELQTSGAFTVTATQSGSFPVQIQALDDTNTAVTTRCSFEVTGEPLVITTDALADGTVGQSYSAGISSRGGVGRVRYGMTSGGLPAGLEFDPNNGSVAGTPEADGTFSVGVSATDDLRRTTSRSLGLRINAGALPFRITTASPLSDALVGRPYSADFAAEGGKAPYTFTIDGVPSGLSAAGNAISGTPDTAGDATISVSARDANGATASKSFLLRVKADGLFIITESLPDGVLGQTYGTGVISQGGRPPFTWSILSGAIPPGVVFNPATGSFDGLPTSSGMFALTVEVADSTSATSRRSYSFEVRPPGVDRLQITTASLPGGSAATAYSASIGATGGRAPYSWSINGDLPPGLAFAADGSITGTPTTVGTRSFQVTVTDSLGLRASRVLSITIGTSNVPALSIEGLPDTANPNQSLPLSLRAASAFPLPVSGRLTLTFAPDTIHNTDDPNIRFGNGSRTLDFTLPAGSTTVNIAGVASIATGTLAGTIRIESTLNFAGTSVPGPTRTIALRRAVPTISAVRLTRTAGGLEVRIEGFTNTRQLAEARVTFTAGSNVDFTGSQFTVNVASAIQSWFANSASLQFGGQFALTLPFTVNGSPADITGVSVIITNGEGASATATAN